MRPIVKFGLTKAVMNRNLHTDVRYGLLYLCGIGIFEPIVIQGAG